MRRTMFYRSLLVPCVLFTVLGSSAQWQPATFAEQTILCEWRFGDAFTIVGTFAGIYRTSDQGASFQPHSQGMPAGMVWRLFHHEGVTYANLFDKGIYTSPDSGRTWSLSRAGRYMYDGAGDDSRFHLVQGQVMVRRYNGDSLYFTNNGGATWTARHYAGGLGHEAIGHGDALYAASPQLGAGQGLYRSMDLGQSWQMVHPGAEWVRFVYGSGNSVHAMGRHIFTSTDGGATFSQVSTQTLPIPLGGAFTPAYFTLQGQRFIAQQGGNLSVIAAYWEPGMTNYVQSASGPPESGATRTMISLGNHALICRANGVWRSTDGGINWSPHTLQGIHAPRVYGLSTAGNEVFGAGDLSTYMGSDAAPDMSAQAPTISWGNTNYRLRTLVRAGAQLRLHLEPFVGNSLVFRSTNNGTTWQSPSVDLLTNARDLRAFVTGDSTIHFGVGGLSADVRLVLEQGNLGTQIGAGAGCWTGTGDAFARSMVKHNGDLYMVVSGTSSPLSKLWRMPLPGGGNWQLVTQVIDGVGQFGSRALGSFNGWLCMGLTDGSGVLRSNDNGLTWESFSAGLPVVVPTYFDSDGQFMLMATDRGLFYHALGATEWTSITLDLMVSELRQARLTPQHVWANMEGGGVWRLPRIGHVGIASHDAQRPAMHVWPNPVADDLQVSNLPADTRLLRIMDAQGREVMVQLADRGPTMSIEVSGLAPGLYTTVVQGSGATATARFVKE